MARPPYTVLHIITRLDRGGSAQNTMLTAIGHDRSRFTPIVVAGRAGRWDDQGGDQATAENCRRLDQAGIRWHLIPSLGRAINPVKDLAAFFTMIRLLRHERPVVVHTHTSKAGVLGRVAAWLTGAPVVVHTPHGHVYYGHFRAVPSRLFLEIERALAQVTTWLIALTEAERDEHLTLGVGRADRFAVVPSGIDLDRYRHAAGAVGRRPPGFDCPPDAIVVGSVGWLTPVKGHGVLIHALARLKPAHPRLYVVIAGSGGLHHELTALADRLGLREAVRLLGERPDIPDCLAAMDLYIHPSLNEGMGRALIEAMAAGRPVVASRVGGIPAIVTDRQTGLLVPPSDPEALASAIDELLRRPEWAKELGAAACASIGPRFAVQAMVKAVEAVYDQALKQTEHTSA
jgi:glycosyltransferase involved in cell wall biosynthesis